MHDRKRKIMFETQEDLIGISWGSCMVMTNGNYSNHSLRGQSSDPSGNEGQAHSPGKPPRPTERNPKWVVEERPTEYQL